MKGRILFLYPEKLYYSGKSKNIDIITSMYEAYTLYDYTAFIIDYNKWESIDVNTRTNILETVKNGGILTLLLPTNLLKVYLDYNYISCENLDKTQYAKTISKRENIKEYFKHDFKRGSIISNNPNITFYPHSYKLEPFMVHELTNKIFYGSMEFNNGKVIFLPKLESYIDKVDLLISIINDFLGLEPVSIRRPDWVEKYLSSKEKQIDKDIAKSEESYKIEKTKLLNEKEIFLTIDKLLYVQNEELENVVKYIFELMGCKVEKTDRGANIDLYISYKNMKFFAEVTGTVSKIDKGSKKLIQVMQGAQDSPNLKPLLIVNTHMDKELDKRPKGEFENFTKDAIKFIQGCNPCCITTADLFYLTEKFLNGETAEKIIKSIYETNGVFNP